MHVQSWSDHVRNQGLHAQRCPSIAQMRPAVARPGALFAQAPACKARLGVLSLRSPLAIVQRHSLFARGDANPVHSRLLFARRSPGTGQEEIVFTNVDIDPDLIARVMALTGFKTKRAAVDAGLRALLMLHEQEEVRDLRGRLHWEGVDLPPAEPETAAKGRGGVRSR